MCALIADDLTGACDAGVQFAKCGLSSHLLFDLAGVGAGAAAVLIANTNSRGDAPEEAVRKLQACGSLSPNNSRPCLFKKIDSTLRGPAAAEIEAALTVFGRRLALIAPVWFAKTLAV